VREFIAEQKEFNLKIDMKVEKVQYYLENNLVQSTKMLLEEQIELKKEIDTLDHHVSLLDNTVTHIMSELKYLQLKPL
jgi:hypothetical protein